MDILPAEVKQHLEEEEKQQPEEIIEDYYFCEVIHEQRISNISFTVCFVFIRNSKHDLGICGGVR